MRLAIVGGRDFNDYELMCRALGPYKPDIVLCGGARGADALS